MESDYDEWFKLEQEKLEKKFFEESRDLIGRGEELDDSREKFERKFKKLMVDYEEKNFRQMEFQKWKKLLIKPVKAINKGMHEFVIAFREE